MKYYIENGYLWEFDANRNIRLMLGKATEADLKAYGDDKTDETVNVSVDEEKTPQKPSKKRKRKNS